jgi:hypothetical protein
MLTNTQLRTATTQELKRLQERIAKELAQRQQDAQQRFTNRGEDKAHTGRDKRFLAGSSGHYQWEYVQCGNAKRCRKCRAGEKHGPYLYRYFYQKGKQKSEYIKLSDLPKHPDAPPRPVS